MRNWLHLIALAACWAPSFLFIKIGLNGGIPPVTLAAARVALAAVILAAVLTARGQSMPRDGATWRRLLPMALLSTAIPFALFSIGERYADSGLAAILNGTTPIFTVILAQIFLRDEPLTGRTLAGVLIGFAGIVVIFSPELRQGLFGGPASPSLSGGFGDPGIESTRAVGLVAFTIAGACYGGANVYARRRLGGLPSLVAPTLQMTLAGLILVGMSFAFEAPMAARPGPAAIGSVLVLAVVGTALAYMLYYPLMARTSATFVSLVTYLLPPAGIVLGMLVLGEKPGWEDLAGCALIILGVAVVSRR